MADPKNPIKNRLVALPKLIFHSIPMETHIARTQAINLKLTAIAAHAGIPVLDPAEWMCSSSECAVTDENGDPIFYDGTHLRASYVEKNIRVFDPFVLPGRKHATFVDGTANARYHE